MNLLHTVWKLFLLFCLPSANHITGIKGGGEVCGIIEERIIGVFVKDFQAVSIEVKEETTEVIRYFHT